jgi:hypothetical protein
MLVVALGGCINAAGFVKKNEVSLPLLVGAAAADFLVTAQARSNNATAAR